MITVRRRNLEGSVTSWLATELIVSRKGCNCHQPQGTTMSSIRTIFAAVAVISICATGIAMAQTTTTKPPPPNTSSTSATTANPELQRQLSPQRRASKKQRRADCERQAAHSKLSRWQFMRQCLKG